MRFIVQQAAFRRALAAVSPIFKGRVIKPILANVKLVATESGLWCEATDLERTAIVRVIEVDSLEPGIVLLNHGRGCQIVDNCGDGQVTFSLSDDKMRFVGSAANYTLPTENPAEFPAFQKTDATEVIKLPCAVLKAAFDAVSPSTAENSERYALDGVCLDLTDGKPCLVSTDTRTLAVYRLPGECNREKDLRVLPLAAVKLAIECGDGKEITVSGSENSISFAGEGFVIQSRLIAGMFPNWRSVLPKTIEGTFVNTTVGAMLTLLKRAVICADSDPKFDTRSIDFRVGENEIAAQASGAGLGEAQTRMPASVEGPSVGITFGFQKLSNAMRGLSGELPIQFVVSSPAEAGFVKTETGYTAMVMPITRD